MRFLVVFFLLLGFQSSAQKSFSGVFNYKASLLSPDSNKVIANWNVVVFTNDTIVRVETTTPNLGKQVYIRHTALNKAYLLLEVNNVNYAIQTDLDKRSKADTIKEKYSFKKKVIGKKINGLKCARYIVTPKSSNQSFTCYFSKKYPGKYLEVFPEMKGLAVDYYLSTNDGIVHYELMKVEEKVLSRDLFGVPSDYKRVTFSEFMKIVAE